MNPFVQRFFETIVLNVGVFVAACFYWGVPGVALFDDFEQYESVVVGSIATVVAGLLFFSFFLFVQLLVFSLLVSIVRRRLLAIAASPLAVGVLFSFADYGFGPTVFLAGLTISFGCSAYVADSPAWWQRRPTRVLWAAGVFAIVFVAIALSQSRQGSSPRGPMLAPGAHSPLESGEWWPLQGYASRSSRRRSRQAVPQRA